MLHDRINKWRGLAFKLVERVYYYYHYYYSQFLVNVELFVDEIFVSMYEEGRGREIVQKLRNKKKYPNCYDLFLKKELENMFERKIINFV